MNQRFESDPFDKEPSRNRLTTRGKGVLAAAAATVAGAVGFNLPHSAPDKVGPGYVLAVCEGEQVIPNVKGGATYTNLVEDYVNTDPADRLKSGENLTKIAKAVSEFDFDGSGTQSIPVYSRVEYPASSEVQRGADVSLPDHCKSVAEYKIPAQVTN